MEIDEGIQATNDDATECKRSAVQLGYWEDKYISLFFKTAERKAPEINRGYFARTRGVRIFIEKFLSKTGNNCQIINLGSGFDTLYWLLRDKGYKITNFIEVDFPSVTSRKCYFIKRNQTLLNSINIEDGEVRFSSTDMHAGNYHLIGVDLRNYKDIEHKFAQSELNLSLPTLFIAECVLVYIEPRATHELLSWISSKFQNAMFINYEQVNMGDKFASVMLSNLRARGCPLAGVDACQSLESQKKRFLDSNWDGAAAWDMNEIYLAIPGIERQRIERIEFLDEHELLMQLFQHYCIVIGWKGNNFNDVDIT